MKTPKQSWIVLCATQRSGSTMVCDDLNRHGLGFPEERFLGIVNSVKSGPVQSVKSRIKANLNACKNKETGISAVKVMASYAGKLNVALDQFYDLEKPSTNWSSIARLFKNATFVMLHRGNYMEQALSRVISRRTGINHNLVSKESDFVPGKSLENVGDDHGRDTKFTQRDIRVEIRNIATENQMWSLFFERNNIAPVYLHYENVSGNTDYIDRIAAALGYSLPQAPRERNVRKLPRRSGSRLPVGHLKSTYPEFFQKPKQSVSDVSQ